jgi:hypothetical protein
VSNSGKCDKEAANADCVLQQTLLAAAVSLTNLLLEKAIDRHCSAPSPRPVQLKSVGPPAQHPSPAVQPAPHQAFRWPHPDGWLIRPNRVAVKGAGHRSSRQAAQAVSADPPPSRIRQQARPQFPPRKCHRVSTLAPNPRQRKLPPEVQKALQRYRCGRGQ